ncbi:MAG TPA: APC family permease [Candidatus Omnitrophota bacterium]|nr:APC family permease [Candidatus Omnitrophota bacterium]HOX09487.1 APC family permease [Candidatus Omnitrophota bacterium]
MASGPGIGKKLKNIVIGGAHDPHDTRLFHKISLIAFFAWIGIGADGLSSSCYGPQEAFVALQGHMYLGIFVALATAITIFVISASYSQLIEVFPSGGGGYLVASKLLSPRTGMVSGCALLIDYVLTITVSVASGADALFSFLPADYLPYKLVFASAVVFFLIVLNLRGIKESVSVLMPIFLTFVVTHAFLIIYALVTHMMNFPEVVSATREDLYTTSAELGMMGMVLLVMRAYSMGAGTYTGIEAVSNSLPMLREPKVQTAKRTMNYMAISLAVTVLGLMLAYILYGVQFQEGKTINAVLLESVTAPWSRAWGVPFLLITLVSEALLLFVAAQTGFVGGPRILANMALDRWVPSRFATLSDRFVTQNGVMIMGVAALIMMLATRGSVALLVVLYSINVFITFLLSQMGMVRYWWSNRKRLDHWRRKLAVNGIGLALTAFILLSVTIIKFNDGGWKTIFVTGTLVLLVTWIKRHYDNTAKLLKRLDSLVMAAGFSSAENIPGITKKEKGEFDPEAKTAVLLVNGFNGTGLHTLFNIFRLFGDSFKNFVFLQIGVIDAGNFKGAEEIDRLEAHAKSEIGRYVKFVGEHGYHAEGIFALGTDVVQEASELALKLTEKYPQAVFFGGQIVFPKETFLTRLLHNYTVFSMQRKFYHEGIPVVILPIRV